MLSLDDRLRNQYGDHGIYAGSSHFHDYWCRDSMFASFGALSIGDYEVVGRTLNKFLDALREDGHVAMRIGTKNQVLRYLGLPTTSGVHHNQDKGNNEVYDSNSLLLIVAEKYEELSGKTLDRQKIRSVIRWLDETNKSGLLYEGKYASWDDSLKHTGARFYTNVCFYRAQLAAAKLLGDPSYIQHAEKTKSEIIKWWNGKYFVDGLNPACLVAGNLLAILWGVATSEQSLQILNRISNRKSIIPPAGFWKPGLKDVFSPFFLIHIHDYHGMMEWSWLAAAEIAALRTMDEETEANDRTKSVMRLIEQNDTLHEVYERDKPVRRLIYKSEKDFAWALGLLIASRPSGFSVLI